MSPEELVAAVLRSLPPAVRSEVQLAGGKGGIYAQIKRAEPDGNLLTLAIFRALGPGDVRRLDVARDPIAAGDLCLDLSRSTWVAEILRKRLGLETYWLIDGDDIKGGGGPRLAGVLPASGGSR